VHHRLHRDSAKQACNEAVCSKLACNHNAARSIMVTTVTGIDAGIPWSIPKDSAQLAAAAVDLTIRNFSPHAQLLLQQELQVGAAAASLPGGQHPR
jgi:hypothetical protein